MAGLSKLLKNLISLSRSFARTTRPGQPTCDHPSPSAASRTVRPGLEGLEDRLVPSTTVPAGPVISAQAVSTGPVNLSNPAGSTWILHRFVTTPTIDHPTAQGAYTPMTGPLFGAHGPSYLDVRQGAVGDCWLLAGLAEVAAREPSVITSMFTYQGTTVENGVEVELYTVRLYNTHGAAFSVTVDTELPAGGDLYDHPANGVLWVALAEKAYAEANGKGLVRTGAMGSDSYSALSGGDPSWALQAITGQSAHDFAINPTNIAAAWQAGELIVLSTYSPSSSWIVPDHAYAVVNYNASSFMPFMVYNPWGTDSSGWALGDFDGHNVYGLFIANAAFLSHNFTWQSVTAGVPSLPVTLDAGFGPASVQASLNQALAPTNAVWQPGFALPGSTLAAAGALEQSAGTAELEQPGRDALWAAAGTSESPASFLGRSLFHEDMRNW